MSDLARSRIRVVQTVLDLEAGGLERVVADLASRLDPARFDVHVMALRFFGRHAEGLERHATLHVAPPLPRWTMVWPRPLARTLRAIAPDIVHTHSGAWFKTARAARLANVPASVHTEHGRPDPDPWPGRVVEYLASRDTDVLIAVSRDLGGKMAKWVSPNCRIEVVENGVDTDVFAPDEAVNPWLARLGIPPGTPVIGCVARLDPIKNFEMLLEALALVRREWSDGAPPVLVLAGDGPERQNITALVERLQLENAVHPIGWVGATRELYSMFDVFTLSSRSEGTSIALLEAMSAGVCPVVTAVGGNVSVLGPALAGLLVPSEDARALADRWRAMLTNPTERLALGQVARQRVVNHFSLAQMVARHEALYEQLAGRSGGTQRGLRP